MRRRISLLLLRKVDLLLRNKVLIPKASTTNVAPKDINKAISKNETIKPLNQFL